MLIKNYKILKLINTKINEKLWYNDVSKVQLISYVLGTASPLKYSKIYSTPSGPQGPVLIVIAIV